jgi:hypothetical protein
VFQVAVSAVSSFVEARREIGPHARYLEQETRGFVKKAMFFSTICCFRRQVVLFLLLCMGIVEKGSNEEGLALPEGARGCHERFLISKKAERFPPS